MEQEANIEDESHLRALARVGYGLAFGSVLATVNALLEAAGNGWRLSDLIVLFVALGITILTIAIVRLDPVVRRIGFWRYRPNFPTLYWGGAAASGIGLYYLLEVFAAWISQSSASQDANSGLVFALVSLSIGTILMVVNREQIPTPGQNS